MLDFGTPIIRSDNDVTQRLKKVYVPRFYLDTYDALQACSDIRGGVFVVGSPGTGKAVMRNVHAWCIANAMKLDTGAREVKILFATHNGRQEWVRAILVVLTRDTDGRVQAEAVEHDEFMKIILSRHDYVLAYFIHGYKFIGYPVPWRAARLWGYSDPVATRALQLTLDHEVLYTPSGWPVEELVRAAAALDLTIPSLEHHHVRGSAGIHEVDEVNEGGLADRDARISKRAELFGGVPSICLETHPWSAAAYASAFIYSCLNAKDHEIWSEILSHRNTTTDEKVTEGRCNLHQMVVGLVTFWPPKRWYSLSIHTPLPSLERDALVCSA